MSLYGNNLRLVRIAVQEFVRNLEDPHASVKTVLTEEDYHAIRRINRDMQDENKIEDWLTALQHVIPYDACRHMTSIEQSHRFEPEKWDGRWFVYASVGVDILVVFHNDTGFTLHGPRPENEDEFEEKYEGDMHALPVIITTHSIDELNQACLKLVPAQYLD